MSTTKPQAQGQTGKEKEKQENRSSTHEAGCHCGYIKFSVTLSPPLPEHKIMQCNCSACSHLGYLLVYPSAEEISWRSSSNDDDGRDRVSRYRFNTRQKDHMFCPKCGASLGIDFRDVFAEHTYGINVRTFYGIDLDTLSYRKLNGAEKVEPAEDLSGHIWDEEKQELK
ncbi:hypothetical protein AAE478_005611 [Parahypoxylon ruwenzoriense]